jgi:hypothetical protein
MEVVVQKYVEEFNTIGKGVAGRTTVVLNGRNEMGK